MIKVHRLNGQEFIINCELIKFIESTPDTLITLVSDEKLMVREPIDALLTAVRSYKQGILAFPEKGR